MSPTEIEAVLKEYAEAHANSTNRRYWVRTACLALAIGAGAALYHARIATKDDIRALMDENRRDHVTIGERLVRLETRVDERR